MSFRFWLANLLLRDELRWYLAITIHEINDTIDEYYVCKKDGINLPEFRIRRLSKRKDQLESLFGEGKWFDISMRINELLHK